MRPYGAVGPAIYFLDVTQQIRFEPFTKGTHTVARVTLVAHLGHDLVFLGGLGKDTCLVNIVRDRFLQIYVLTHPHSAESLDRMVMIRGGDTYGIEVLTFLLVHLTEVVEILRLRVFLTSVGRLTVVYVAQTGDRRVFVRRIHQATQIGGSHTATAYFRDIKLIAGSYMS